MSCRRGTTNTNQRGSAADRRRRKQYLLDTFGDGRTALCVFCGTELSFETISVDRIKPGVNGGRYTRDNIRPACSPCQSRQGGAIAKVKAALGRLDGSEMAALSLITGLDTDELNDLGGL